MGSISSDPRAAAFRWAAHLVAAHHDTRADQPDQRLQRCYQSLLQLVDRTDCYRSTIDQLESQCDRHLKSSEQELTRWQKIKVWVSTLIYSADEKYFARAAKIMQKVLGVKPGQPLTPERLQVLALEEADVLALTALMRHPSFPTETMIAAIQVLTREQVQRLFQAAAAAGNKEIVEALLMEHRNWCEQDDAYQEAFLAAAEHRHAPVIGLLITRRAEGKAALQFDAFIKGLHVLVAGESLYYMDDMATAFTYAASHYATQIQTHEIVTLLKEALRGGWDKERSNVIETILQFTQQVGSDFLDTLFYTVVEEIPIVLPKLLETRLIGVAGSSKNITVSQEQYKKALQIACRQKDTWTVYYLVNMVGVRPEMRVAVKNQLDGVALLPRISEYLDGHKLQSPPE